MKQDQVIAALRARVDTQEGTRLPAERALAAELGCSRQSLRAALAVLEAEGLLWRHVGQGTFLGPRPPGLPVRETVLLTATSPAQLMQARRMVEPPVAAEAAQRATPADVAHLSGLVAQGRRARNRPEAEQADAAFHRAVAETARNPVLLGLLDYLSGARRRAAWQQEWERTYRRTGVEEFTRLHSDQHAAVVAAIAAADAPGAEAAMRTHLDTITAAIFMPRPPQTPAGSTRSADRTP